MDDIRLRSLKFPEAKADGINQRKRKTPTAQKPGIKKSHRVDKSFPLPSLDLFKYPDSKIIHEKKKPQRKR